MILELLDEAIFAVFSVLALSLVLLPMFKQALADKSDTPAVSRIDVYRDQLEAIDREITEGIVQAAEAENAKTEIERRILNSPATDNHDQRLQLSSKFGAGILIISLALSVGLYFQLGSPNSHDQPQLRRLAEPIDENDSKALLERAEYHISRNPDDGRGWDTLAPVYLRMGLADKAANAFRNSIRISGQTAARLIGLGDALVRLNEGTVTSEAQEAFENAVALQPGLVEPRIYLAIALAQQGDVKRAIDIWNDLLAGAKENAPWRGFAERQLAHLKSISSGKKDGFTEEQLERISGMVSSLQARLDKEEGSVDDWLRLIRSYGVLGDDEKLRAAFEAAMRAYESNPAAREAFIVELKRSQLRNSQNTEQRQ